jgi:hypothetical protein
MNQKPSFPLESMAVEGDCDHYFISTFPNVKRAMIL